MDVIEVVDLTKDYGHGRGVFDVSFSVKQGEVFGFLGPNGAGKSTTIRHIMGFSKPQKGSTKVYGLESFSNYDKIMGKIGYLPGEIALPEGLTGTEFLKMMADLRGSQQPALKDYLLKLFKLDPKLETKSMSLGDKRKLAIVAAFMNDPDVLILDEPTSGLDPVMQQTFIDFIKDEKKKGKTILLSSHIFNEVEQTCDRISIIKDGRIVSTFETNVIKHNENKQFEIYFDSLSEFNRFAHALPKVRIVKGNVSKAGIRTMNEKELKVVVALKDKDVNKLTELLSEYKIKAFKQVKFTLEDYFMQFYREDKDFGGVKWKKKSKKQ